MPVQFSEAEAERLIKFYTEVEREILDRLNRGLLRGNKTEYLAQMKKNIESILADLRVGNRTWCEEATARVYAKGVATADMMIEARGQAVIGGFGAIHQQAAQILAENTFQRLGSVAQLIGRRTESLHRDLALENIRGSVVGYDTWQQVARKYREDLAKRGVTGFRDAAGREWNMRTYAEMVARTSTQEAHTQGTLNRLAEHGHDLIVVSKHGGACEKCVPWEGRVLSITGKTEGYPTFAEAKAAGLMHPNCRHAVSLWVDLDKEPEGLEQELNQAGGQSGSGGQAGGVPGAPAIPVTGIPTTAHFDITQAIAEALSQGLKTKNECLLTLDAKDGKIIYNKVVGTQDSVQFPQQLVTLLNGSPANSVLLVHNHPNSSSFSDADVRMIARFDSMNGMFISGHDGTKYYLGKLPNTSKFSEKVILAEYQKFMTKYHGHYSKLVSTGQMTPNQAWKEHSHKIMEDLAQSLGLEYRRWDAP